jgi:hypothetical protein
MAALGAALGIALGAALAIDEGAALGIALVSGVDGAEADGMAGMSAEAEVVGGVTVSGGFLSPPQATERPTAAVTANGAKTKSLTVRMFLISGRREIDEGRPR